MGPLDDLGNGGFPGLAASGLDGDGEAAMRKFHQQYQENPVPKGRGSIDDYGRSGPPRARSLHADRQPGLTDLTAPRAPELPKGGSVAKGRALSCDGVGLIGELTCKHL